MKQMIVFLAMLSLGCILFCLIAGGDDSVYGAVREVWRAELEMVR